MTGSQAASAVGQAAADTVPGAAGRRLKGVAYRRIEPNTARTTVAMTWRTDDQNPLVARFLEAPRSEP